jgi:phosphate transport system protein
MARRAYRDRLDNLTDGVLEMGALVRSRLDRALRAVADHDEYLAQAVIDNDRDVNDRYLALESECISLLALQQPVASDLRVVVASFKILTDLERIGDLATNLASYALAGDPKEFPEIDLAEITALASRMVEDAIGAYAVGDDEWACREVAALDDDLDARCEHASSVVVKYLLDYELDTHRATATDPDREFKGEAYDERATVDRLLNDVSPLLYTIRDLERIGDRAVNIAGRTLYMVESDSTLL